MKLNLHIIWDELQEYGGELVCTDDISFSLAGVRYATDSVLSEQYLYLIDAEALFDIPADTKPLSVVCLGETEEDRGWSVISLPAGVNRDKVFREIQEVFEKYAQWEQEMLLSIANGEPLQSIFDRGVRFLHNPVALFDTSLVFIMMAGTLPANIENTIWEDVLAKGYSRIENYPVEEQRLLEKMFEEHDEPFFNQTQGKYSKHQQILAALKRDGSLIANFGMIDILEPFTLGQLSIVSYLKNFMELALSKDLNFASSLNDSGYFVERLLQGFSVERHAVEYHLTRKSWHVEDEFCLWYFTKMDGSRIDDTVTGMYVFRLRSVFAGAMVFPYESGILVISHGDDGSRTDSRFIDELSLLLKNIGMCCGVSLSFHDFMNLKYAYIQCKTALASSQNERISLFETRYTEHVIKALDASTSLKSLCHPQILSLYHMEGGKGQEYVHSLQTYLNNGRNKTAAAASLFIHRNTLLYRLSRIEEMLEIDIETADEQTLFMLYLSCLLTTHIN